MDGSMYGWIKLFEVVKKKGVHNIQTNKNNAQEIQVNQCSFTRNQLPDTVQDYSEVVRGTKFEDDLVFLKNNFESKVDDKNELKAKKYEKVDPELVPVFLGISLVFMLIGFLVIKRVGKKNP